MKSIARNFDGTRNGISYREKYFDQANQLVMMEPHGRVGVTGAGRQCLAIAGTMIHNQEFRRLRSFFCFRLSVNIGCR